MISKKKNKLQQILNELNYQTIGGFIFSLFGCSHRDEREGYEVRMCTNCGHEEEMYFMERWCKRCKGI